MGAKVLKLLIGYQVKFNQVLLSTKVNSELTNRHRKG